MSVITLPSQNLMAWQKVRLEGKIDKWLESQRVSAPQINVGSSMAAVASMSVSQAEKVFVRGANTAMKINGSITGDLATWQKKFTVRQWAALIGFFGVETQKWVQKNWKQIEKARDASEVGTIVVTATKEKQVDVDKQSSRVWFGNDVAEYIWKNRFI